jgi:hypothetical protein
MEKVNKKKLLHAWNTYKDETVIPSQYIGKWHISYREIESEFLYSVIRYYKPKKILEISPDRGGTTRIMLLAVEKNKEKCEILSYDILSDSMDLDRNDDKISRRLILGDVKDTIIFNDIRECDLLFMDCAHSYDFGKWYSKHIIPYLEKNTLVFIHDWEGYEGPGSNRNIVPPWGKVIGPDEGEAKAVKKFSVKTKLLEPIINLEDELAHEAFKRGHKPDQVYGTVKGEWWDPEKKKPLRPYAAINPTQILQRTKNKLWNEKE